MRSPEFIEIVNDAVEVELLGLNGSADVLDEGDAVNESKSFDPDVDGGNHSLQVRVGRINVDVANVVDEDLLEHIVVEVLVTQHRQLSESLDFCVADEL